MNIEKKKKLGAFYTPSEVTDVLSNWAIQNQNDRILEPSFGGCNFLTSSIKRLQELGAENPAESIVGFDIDPIAFVHLREKGINGGSFFQNDFLESNRNDFNFSVSVILGNPPYLPIHKLDGDYKKKVYRLFKNSEFRIPKRSSLWVYFIINSFQYLADGGRMAWIVPDSIAFTGYGGWFLNVLCERFLSVKLIRIQERFFYTAGTQEKTSILICNGYNIGTAELVKINAEHLSEGLAEVTNEVVNHNIDVVPTLVNVKNDYRKLTLGSVFNIRIGIVLGATKLVTFKNAEIDSNPYFPDFLYPVITKGKQLTGLDISAEKLLKDSVSPVYLVDALKLEKENPLLFTHFTNGIPPQVLLNDTFSNRKNLFEYDDFKHPDGFLTFYSQKLPRVVLNLQRQLNCTNSVHRLYLKDDFHSKTWIVKFICLQFFGNLFYDETLSKARQYGNKIKKYEPSDAANIPIVLPVTESDEIIFEIETLFAKVSALVDVGKENDARTMIDDFFFENILENTTVNLFVA